MVLHTCVIGRDSSIEMDNLVLEDFSCIRILLLVCVCIGVITLVEYF